MELRRGGVYRRRWASYRYVQNLYPYDFAYLRGAIRYGLLEQLERLRYFPYLASQLPQTTTDSMFSSVSVIICSRGCFPVVHK